MKQYRAPFYAQLQQVLRREGIRLVVAYSLPTSAEAQKEDTCDLPSDYGKAVKCWSGAKGRIVYQPLLTQALASDLVIVTEGNKFVLNHALLWLSRAGIARMAMWGLAENRQNGRSRGSEWYRRRTLDWPTWWFAYTQGTTDYLQRNGVPASKITTVQNAVDTRRIRDRVSELTLSDGAALRARMGIPKDAPVGIFCGMLDPVKGIPFLLKASEIVRRRVPDFHLIVVGGGVERVATEELVRGHTWIHLVGPRFGDDKAELLAISDVFVLPGRVGLAVLDAFAAGLPLITTKLSIHGPEIEYLNEQRNGLITEPEVGAYADTVVQLLGDKKRLQRLKRGAVASSEDYSIENMVANFADGVRSCLACSAPKGVRNRL